MDTRANSPPLRTRSRFIMNYEESSPPGIFVRYEVHVRYTNSDEIRGTFESKTEAIRFLNSMQ
jgi:hypothetical protein